LGYIYVYKIYIGIINPDLGILFLTLELQLQVEEADGRILE
jgi:hypothetical protein